MRRRACLLLVPCLALIVLGCFEQPITESMEIRFLTAEAVMVRVLVRIADPDRFRDSEPARARIEEERRRIEEGRDEWSARIEGMDPPQERIILDRSGGRVVRVERKVIVTDPDGVRRFFNDTPVAASIRRSGDEVELTLVPGSGGRAGRAEEEALRRETATWAESVHRYLEAGRRLYDHLDANPDRAAACFADLFGDLVPAETRHAHGEPTAGDQAVLKPFNDAMGEIMGLFAVPNDAAYSVEETSRRVHDPFPAPLTVRVPGPVLESEGFEPGEQGILKVPPVSLWSAFSRLRGRWMTPDPATVYYEHTRNGRRPFDLDGFLAQRRRATPPSSPSEIVLALDGEMRAAPIYRVRWSAAGLAEPEGEGDVWDQPALQ